MPPPRGGAPNIDTHHAQWNVLDDAKLACLQKGHATRWGVLERHQRSYFALRDSHAGRDRWPVGAGAGRGEAHEPANATAKWRRCVGARGGGGTRSLARCRDACPYRHPTLAYQLDIVRLAGRKDHRGLEHQVLQPSAGERCEPNVGGHARDRPQECFPLDDACRRLMQSKREHKARLYFGGARCGSACVYAMIGSSTRRVDPGATLRIHSSVGREIDKTQNSLRRYVVGMGVDPALVDAAAKIPPRTFRGLSRGEIERFGIETRGVHETPWFAYHGPAGEFLLLESVTYPTGDTGDQY